MGIVEGMGIVEQMKMGGKLGRWRERIWKRYRMGGKEKGKTERRGKTIYIHF